MTERLVITSRDELASALTDQVILVLLAGRLADRLIDSGAVRVLDPDDPDLIQRVADVIFTAWQDAKKAPDFAAAQAAVKAVLG